MIPKEIRQKVEKGCGKKFRWKGFYCGAKYPNKSELMFCPTCNAKLSILTEYDKSIKEMIEDLKRKCWTTNQGSVVISFYQLEELLSKIGDNSDNSQTEEPWTRLSSVANSDKEVAQPYSKSDKTTKEVTSND